MKDGEEIHLTTTEYKIMQLLMQSPGRVYTRQQIFEAVWADPYIGDDNTIMVHVSRLREKIEPDPKNPSYVKTVRGLGYKLEKRDDV